MKPAESFLQHDREELGRRLDAYARAVLTRGYSKCDDQVDAARAEITKQFDLLQERVSDLTGRLVEIGAPFPVRVGIQRLAVAPVPEGVFNFADFGSSAKNRGK